MASVTLAALAELTTEALLYQVVQAVAQSLEAYLVNDLADKGSHQELASFDIADTALLHIEEGIFVELTYGSTMTTLDIICVDLKLRLGVHTCLACEAEVAVGLLRVGMLSSLANEHLAGKGTDSLIIEHIFVEFMAGTVAHGMIDEGVIIYMLLLIGNSHAAEVDVCATSCESDAGRIACGASHEGDIIDEHLAIGLLMYIEVAQTMGASSGLLQFVKFE